MVRRVAKVRSCLLVLISMRAWELLVAASYSEHNRHLVRIVSQSRQPALLRPPDHSCAVVAVLTLHHRKAEVAGASQVRTEIIYMRNRFKDIKGGRNKREKKRLRLPRVSSVSKRATAAFQMVNLVSQLVNLSNQPFLK